MRVQVITMKTNKFYCRYCPVHIIPIYIIYVYIITILPSIEDTVGSDCQLGQILDVCRPEAPQLVICHIYFYGTLFSLVCDTYTCE